MFLEARRRLNVPPLRGVVFEDATAASTPGAGAASASSSSRGQSPALELAGDAVRVNAMHCLAPWARAAVNGETYDIAASEGRTFLLK